MRALILLVILLQGCTSLETDDADVFDKAGIYKNLPKGMNVSSLISHLKFLKSKQKNTFGARSSSALAVSREKLGWAYLAWDYSSAYEAKRVALNYCNKEYGECHLYAVNNKIVFDKEKWDQTWPTISN